MWYMMQVLMALDVDIEEIVAMNVEKLQSYGNLIATTSENVRKVTYNYLK